MHCCLVGGISACCPVLLIIFTFFFLSAHVVDKTNAAYVVHNFRVLFAVQRMGVSLL